VRWVVAEPLAAHLPELGDFHLRDFGVVARARPSLADGARVAASALVGSLSHLALDAFTHKGGFAVRHLPALRAQLFTLFGRPVPLYRLLQGGGSLAGAVVTLLLLRHLGRRRQLLRWAGATPRALAATDASRVRLWTTTLAVAAAGIGYRFGFAPAVHSYRDAWYWGHELLQAACYTFVGVCLGCVLARRAMVTPAQRGCARTAHRRRTASRWRGSAPWRGRRAPAASPRRR
jgi:hypothetical protein